MMTILKVFVIIFLCSHQGFCGIMIFTLTMILKNEIFNTRFITHTWWCAVSNPAEVASISLPFHVSLSAVVLFVRLSLHLWLQTLPPPVIVSNIDAQILQCKAQKPDRKTQILNSIRISHQWFLSPSKRKVRPSANVPFSHHIYISTALVLQHLKTSQNSRFPIFLDASFCLNVFTKMTVSKNETHFFSLSLSFLV